MERIQSINPERVRWCCEDSRITVEELAAAAGVPAVNVEKVLVGEDSLTFPQLQRIAKFFNRGVLFFIEPGPVNVPKTGTVPKLPCLDEYALPLAQMVAATSYLPDPGTVAAFGGAVFPTVRNNKQVCELFEGEGGVGMYDDNTTPRWALLWSHGILQTHHPKGWTFAHVWPSQGELKSYTNLANLAMLPECFGTLTDKEGPLTQFLQWHAWETYHWKPERCATPQKPDGYETVSWNYLLGIADPRSVVRCRAASLNNQRIKTLRSITGKPEIL